MNQQFFLDGRDYSKYRLLEHLAVCAGIDQLTMIWMMTSLAPPVGHGGKAHKEDPGFPALNVFFQDRGPHRSINEVEGFFEKEGISCNSYSTNFTKQGRERYFQDIPSEWLRSAVVFFDPDNGMEPSRADEKHLRYEELRAVWRRTDSSSIGCVIQFPRRQANLYPTIAAELSQRILSSHVGWIEESGVAFFIITHTPERLRDVLLQRPDLQTTARVRL